MGAPIIKSGLNTARPMTFAKTRQGFLIGVNGFDRGIFWDGRSIASDGLGIDPPIISPTIYTPTQGDVSASATITITTNNSSDLHDKYVAIKDSEGKQVTYYFDNTITYNNKALYRAANEATVAIKGVAGKFQFSRALMFAIRSAFGHRGSLSVTRSNNVLTVTMSAGGASTNGYAIIDDAGGHITSTAFANGKTLGGSAYATIELENGTISQFNTQTIKLLSTDATEKTYVFDTAGGADKTTGLLNGSGQVYIQLNGLSTAPTIAVQIQAAIVDTTNGHAGKILVGVSGDDVYLYQAIGGSAGNRVITRTVNSGTAGCMTGPSTDPFPTAFAGGSQAGGAIAGDYVCYYRYVDDRDVERFYSNLSVASRVSCEKDDKFEWSGLAPSPQPRVNKVQLLRSTFNSASVFYVVAELPLSGEIESIATSGSESSGGLVLTLPQGHGLMPGMSVTITGTSGSYGDAHNNIFRIASVTSTTATTTFVCGWHSSTGGNWKVEGFHEDNLQDASMVTYRGDWRVKALQNNGRPNANRHFPPPNHKAVCCSFQDRMTYLVDTEYITGNITGSKGSTTVTGIGVKWSSSFAGRTVCPDATKDCGTYTISSVVSDREVVLSTPLEHSFTEIPYAITSPSSERNSVYISEQDLPESVITQIVIQENIRDEDSLVGAVVMGAAYFALKEHSIYRITWAVQPAIDASPQLAVMRGAISHDCADQHEGVLYLMDDEGPYAFQGNQVQPIGTQIVDQWSDQVLDFSKKSTWRVRVDPLEELVYFYVTAIEDSGTRPKRALVYDIRTKTWSQWKYVWEIGDCAKIAYSDQRRLALGSTTEKWYVANEGMYDGTDGSGTTRGTVTEATYGTIKDTSAGTFFPTDCEGASIAIVSGTGKGQITSIKKRVSGGELNVEGWTTTPDSTSVYLIGAVEWMWKSGMFKLVETDNDVDRYFRVTFQPTVNEANMYFRKYDNHSSSPVSMNEWNGGDGVSISQGDTRAIANLKISQEEDGEEPGSKYLPWTGGTPSLRGRPVRWITCEMSGFQGADRIILYELEIGGVQ